MPLMVGLIGDLSRRRTTPALAKERAIAAGVISSPLRSRPPEPAIFATQVPVFEGHGRAPRVAVPDPISRTSSCRVLARIVAASRLPEPCSRDALPAKRVFTCAMRLEMIEARNAF